MSASPKKVWGMEVELGEEAQVDYGSMSLIDGESGWLRQVNLLRVRLSRSRRGYREAMPRQDAESFIRALGNTLRHFVGVSPPLCPDNLKATALKADRHDSHLNPKLLSFPDHYDLWIMPTQP